MATIDERIPQIKRPEPRRKANRKLLVLLFLFFLTILAILFFRSEYSKVTRIEVSGHSLYSAEQIIEASGLHIGMQFLNVWEKKVTNNLQEMAGISGISLRREFPGLVQLQVKEFRRVAFIADEQGAWLPLLENGIVLKDANLAEGIIDKPLIRNWNDPDKLPALAKALSQLSPAIQSEISEIVLVPTTYDDQRLVLYMRDGNEVHTVIHKLIQLSWYPSLMQEIPEGDKGILYLLESTWFSKYPDPEGTELDGETPEEGAER